MARVEATRLQRVKEVNKGLVPSRTSSQQLGHGATEVISFEHINVNRINYHDNFVELTNMMVVLEAMEAGMYSVVETQWDTTSPIFCRYITTTVTSKDKYANASIASNTDKEFLNIWKPGGAMLGVSRRWYIRVKSMGKTTWGSGSGLI